MHRECPFFDMDYESDTEVEIPIVKGCMACNKLRQTCSLRRSTCRRCTATSEPCIYAQTHTRKPKDVTPESILEFRARCLPSREKPSRALVVRPVVPAIEICKGMEGNMGMGDPMSLFSGNKGGEKMMRGVLRAMCTGKDDNKNKQAAANEQAKKEREMQLIRLHEPVKAVFDLSKPEGCPVVQGMFVVDMYTALIEALASQESSTGDVHSPMMVTLGKRGDA